MTVIRRCDHPASILLNRMESVRINGEMCPFPSIPIRMMMMMMMMMMVVVTYSGVAVVSALVAGGPLLKLLLSDAVWASTVLESR